MNPNKLPPHLSDIRPNSQPDSSTPAPNYTEVSTLQSEAFQDQRIVEVATLELLEERALVSKVREVVGQLEVRREIVRRIEHIPVELVSERVILEHSSLNSAGVVGLTSTAFTLDLNGETVTLEPGQRYSFEIYRERAEVSKLAEVVEQVRIGKRTLTETHDVTVELGREQLTLEQDGHLVASEETIRVQHGEPEDGTAGSSVKGDGSSLTAAGLT